MTYSDGQDSSFKASKILIVEQNALKITVKDVEKEKKDKMYQIS